VTRRIDVLSLASAVVAAGVAWAYVVLVHAQDGDPAAWVLVVLVTAAAGTTYAGWRAAPWRVPALGVSTVLLGVLGLAAILSIGLLILVAAGLSLASLVRSLPAHPQPAAGER
jgi:hypothetical protein